MEQFGQIQWLKWTLFLALIHLYSVQMYNRIYSCTELPFVVACAPTQAEANSWKDSKIPKYFKGVAWSITWLTHEKTLHVLLKKTSRPLQGPLPVWYCLFRLFLPSAYGTSYALKEPTESGGSTDMSDILRKEGGSSGPFGHLRTVYIDTAYLPS